MQTAEISASFGFPDPAYFCVFSNVYMDILRATIAMAFIAGPHLANHGRRGPDLFLYTMLACLGFLKAGQQAAGFAHCPYRLASSLRV
ncbi:hypothetical protein KVC_1966 [Ketogulonicigenium vulgare]|nr:hypothetical protein KVC_1966 [Ketogulonicigenium vulgare]